MLDGAPPARLRGPRQHRLDLEGAPRDKEQNHRDDRMAARAGQLDHENKQAWSEYSGQFLAQGEQGKELRRFLFGNKASKQRPT